VDTNDRPFGTTFPYLALPDSGSNSDVHPSVAALAKSSSSGSFGSFLGSRVVSSSALGVGLAAMAIGLVGALRRPRKRVIGNVTA
jgi:hypothetical protein